MIKNVKNIEIKIISQNKNINKTDLIKKYWNFHPRFRFLKTVKRESNFLDLGANNGGLHFWKKSGFIDRSDINMYAVDMFKGEHFDCYSDYQILNLDQDDLKFENDFFDNIFLSHLIEHIKDKKKIISIIHNKIKNNGTVYIEYPSEYSANLPPREEFIEKGFFCSTMNFFDDKTHLEQVNTNNLKEMIKSTGFEILEEGYVNNPYLEEKLISFGYLNKDQEATTYGLWSKFLWSKYLILKKSKTINKTTNIDNALNTISTNGYVFKKNSFDLSNINIPHKNLYTNFINAWPTYSPWISDTDINYIISILLKNNAKTLLFREKLYLAKQLLINCLPLDGEVWELGVYQGGSSLLLKNIINNSKYEKTLRLFDTFDGMPSTDKNNDLHKKGDFNDTSLDFVKKIVGIDSFIDYNKGLIPDTLTDKTESILCFAHIDLDIYYPILSATEFIYSRLVTGGIILFDDYGYPTCPGAKKAVDEFFNAREENIIVLPTGQAYIIKR